VRAVLTGHGNEEHALHRVGVRAERRNVRYVMCYRRRSLDVFAPLLVALRASVAMSASVCLSFPRPLAYLGNRAQSLNFARL